MELTLVDATVWIDYLVGKIDGRTAWLDESMDIERVGLTDLTFCEVLQGIRDESSFVKTKAFLLRFELVHTGGEELALESAQNYRYLRTRGITIRKTIDCILATRCILSGYTLLHNDRDFDPFETHLGLRVIHP